MCFAIINVTIINLGVVTMHYNKYTQKEIIVIEVAVWMFWVFLFSVGYLIAQATF